MRRLPLVLVFSCSVLSCSGPAKRSRLESPQLQPKASAVVDPRQAFDRALQATTNRQGDGLRSTCLQELAELEAHQPELTHVSTKLEEMLTLVNTLSAEEISALQPLPSASLAASLVQLRLAMISKHEGNTDGYEAHLVSADHRILRTTIKKIRSQATEVPVDGAQIAVLLPMTGKHKSVGAELWAGMSVAEVPANVRLEVIDTKGTEEGAILAVDKALAMGALMAVGPVGRRSAAAAARHAAMASLPIVLLAPRSGASNAQAGVFRYVLTPSFEAEQAALLASDLGHQLVAVMAPRDELGIQQAQAFVVAARSFGLEVVAEGFYDPSARHLERDFRNFLELSPKRNRRLRKYLRRYGRKSWKTFSPTIGFDLLYIPDGVRRAALAASYLPYFNVELWAGEQVSLDVLRRKHGRVPRVVQLMGSSGWIDPSLSTRGGPAVEGAIVVGTCPGGQGLDMSQAGEKFHDAFLKKSGHPASTAAAAAFDAMTLALLAQQRAIAATTGGATREDARGALASARLRDGVCGNLLVDNNGQLQGQIDVLEVRNGVLEIFEH